MMDENKTKILKTINKEDLGRWLSSLLKEYEVIAPVKESDGSVFFRVIKSEDEVCMDFSNTVLSPKEFFIPRSQTIFEFSGDDISTEGIDNKKRILFGVRPCDVNSLAILDEVYTGEICDPYYKARRENTLIISLGCNDPGDCCFCKPAGGSPYLCDSDIKLTDLGDKYLIETGNGKNNIKILNNTGIFKEASGDDIKLGELKAKQADDKFTGNFDLDKLNNIKKFNDKFLDEQVRKCIGCALCTYICPTCTCFDVSDEAMISQQKGRRVKSWDSCMLPSFTLLAGGENPRAKKSERFKQRIYHKFKYHLENYGKIACVGCGRCIKKCPVNIDVRYVVDGAAG